MAETAQALQIARANLATSVATVERSYKQIREDLIKDKALRLD